MNTFENDTMKISGDEKKLDSLWATIQFCFVSWYRYCIILKIIRTSILNVNTANMKRLSGSEKIPELSKKPACEYMPFSLLLAAKGVKRAPLFLQWGARAHFLYSGWWAYSSARASDFFIHFFGAHYTTMTLKLHSATYEFLCQPLSGANSGRK